MVYIRGRLCLASDRHRCDTQDNVALREYVGVAMGRVAELMVLITEISDDCQTVMTFYATSLQPLVGPYYKAPDVVYLARQWLDASSMSFPAVYVLVIY